MIELRVPTRNEIGKLKQMVEFNPEEQGYWDDMKQRRDSQFNKNDFTVRIRFYLNELQLTNGRFSKRIAVEYRLKSLIGHAYEWLGTYGLEGHDPSERAEMFTKAVLWYQAADETVGFLSDCALRQSEACAGAAHFRRQAGLEDNITEWFSQRVRHLDSAICGRDTITIGYEGDVPDYLKQLADVTVAGAGKIYAIIGTSQDFMLN